MTRISADTATIVEYVTDSIRRGIQSRPDVFRVEATSEQVLIDSVRTLVMQGVSAFVDSSSEDVNTITRNRVRIMFDEAIAIQRAQKEDASRRGNFQEETINELIAITLREVGKRVLEILVEELSATKKA